MISNKYNNRISALTVFNGKSIILPPMRRHYSGNSYNILSSNRPNNNSIEIKIPQKKERRVSEQRNTIQLKTLPVSNSTKFLTNFLEKLEICCNLYNLDEKEEKCFKKETLLQILQFINSNIESNVIIDNLLIETLKMIYLNIFRPFPKINLHALFYDESLLFNELNWIHLNLIYLILIQLQFQNLKSELFGYSFIEKLLPLISTPFSLERNYLVKIFKRFIKNNDIYLNDFLKLINNIILKSLLINNCPFSIATLLPVLFKIIQKESLKKHFIQQIFLNNILPLFQDQYLFIYQVTFFDIIEFCTDNDQLLSIECIKYILKYFPKFRISKQTFFLRLLLKLIHQTPLKCLIPFSKNIFSLFINSLFSNQSCLIDASFNLWTGFLSEKILRFFSDQINSLLVQYLPEKIYSINFSEQIKQVISIMIQIDNKGFHNKLKNFHQNILNSPIQKKKSIWTSIIQIAINKGFKKDYYDFLREITETYKEINFLDKKPILWVKKNNEILTSNKIFFKINKKIFFFFFLIRY